MLYIIYIEALIDINLSLCKKNYIYLKPLFIYIYLDNNVYI